MGTWLRGVLWGALSVLVGCHEAGDPVASESDAGAMAAPPKASEHFMMPFKSCAEGDEFCFWNANGGCVPAGERFDEHGSCETVRTQGIPWTRPVRPPSPAEPRLSDPKFAAELEWVTEQVEACACVCCHDSDTGSANIYDVSDGASWVSAMTDRGLMMGAGRIDTTVLGAFPPDDNHGFDRYTTVFPTTDVERFSQFFMDELAYRGVTEATIANTDPLGGPLTENMEEETQACRDGVGIDATGAIHWPGGEVRYAWVLEPGSANPGTPPNLDVPVGTIWQASVHHEDVGIKPGRLLYSAMPAGARQTYPLADEGAPPLEEGATYKLFLMPDHGQYRWVNCRFDYPIEAP